MNVCSVLKVGGTSLSLPTAPVISGVYSRFSVSQICYFLSKLMFCIKKKEKKRENEMKFPRIKSQADFLVVVLELQGVEVFMALWGACDDFYKDVGGWLVKLNRHQSRLKI